MTKVNLYKGPDGPIPRAFINGFLESISGSINSGMILSESAKNGLAQIATQELKIVLEPTSTDLKKIDLDDDRPNRVNHAEYVLGRIAGLEAMAEPHSKTITGFGS